MSADVLLFPEARAILQELIDGTEHAGQTVRAVWFLEADEYGALLGPFPVAVVYTTGGSLGAVDRVDRCTVELYAPGEAAVHALESVRASVCGTDLETSAGYADEIRPIALPAEAPYPSDTLNKAIASFEVVTRPI